MQMVRVDPSLLCSFVRRLWSCHLLVAARHQFNAQPVEGTQSPVDKVRGCSCSDIPNEVLRIVSESNQCLECLMMVILVLPLTSGRNA